MPTALDRATALLAAMAFVTQLGVAVMLPLLPLYAQALGATPFVLGLVVSSFSVALAVGQFASGFLAERFAARRLVVGGLGVYALANGVIAAASGAAQLVAFRAIAGLGAGVNQVAERLYLAQVADRTRLAFANGLLSAAGSAGTVMGPTIGGLLAALADLRAPFVVVAVTSLVAAIAGWFLPAPPRRPAMAASAPTSRGTDTGPLVPAADTGPLVPAADQGPLPPSMTSRLVVLFVVQLGFQTTFGAFITTFAPFGSERLGWSTAEIGLVFSLFGLGSVLLGPLLARLADRRGRRLFGVVGTALIFPFAIVYVVEAPRLVLYPVTIIAGAGVTTLEATWFALLGDATDGGRRGRVFGSVVALSSLGVALGAIIAAQLWERSGDAGLGMLFASVTVALTGLTLLAHPADRPIETADHGSASDA